MEEKGVVSWRLREALKSLYNERVKNGLWKRSFKRLPSRSRRGGVTAYDVKKELKSEFEKNGDLINLLKKIEANWMSAEKLIWGEKDSIVSYYRGISFLTDPKNVEMENEFFKEGTGFKEEPFQNFIVDGSELEVKKYSLEEVEQVHLEPGGEQIKERLSIIGHSNVLGIKSQWERLYSLWLRKAGNTGVSAEIMQALNELDDLFSKELPNVGAREQEFQKNWLAKASDFHAKSGAMRTKLEGLRPQNVRFYHTYKIIAPAIKNTRYNPKSDSQLFSKPLWTFPEFCEVRNVQFKRDDEVAAGLDENGWPLEIYLASDGNYYVLLDKWWKEISKNPWQEKIIKSKPRGDEIWDAKVNNGVLKYGIRKVPKFFAKDLDLLSTAAYIYNEFDAVRDDLRDGRYHRHSKTATDYIFAGEGISTIFYDGPMPPADLKKACGKLPFKIGVEPVIPRKGISKEFEPVRPENYTGMAPDDFLDVPDDEKKVTSRYQIKLNTSNEGNSLGYRIEHGIRRPSHLDPAFDRRALEAKAYKFNDDFFVHWGRMYYYEGPEGINRWSENPFPIISSRGIAKYLIHRILLDLLWDDALEAIENPDGYDFGLRRPLVGSEDFTTNPLKAMDLISSQNSLDIVHK